MAYYDHKNNPREHENDPNFDYNKLSEHLRDCIADLEYSYGREPYMTDCLEEAVYAGINGAKGLLTDAECDYLYKKHILGG